MKILSVNDPAFRRYGQVLQGYDFSELLAVLEKTTPKPQDRFVYVASDPALEKLEVSKALQNRGFGGLPIQVGYCNGTNDRLNCLEYHRSSEICVMADDVILLLGCQADLDDYQLDTARVEAFLVKAGTGIELFATTLHYAPCSAAKGQGYRVINVLPRGTNADKPSGLSDVGEDRLCLGANKWLIAHKDAPEASTGAFVGLLHDNILLY